MVKLGIVICIVFFASLSHALLGLQLKRQFYEYSTEALTNLIHKTNESIIQQYNTTIKIVDDLLTNKLSESIAGVEQNMTATVEETNGIIDWTIQRSRDRTGAAECAKLKRELERLKMAALTGIKKCAEKLLSPRKENITKAEMRAIENMSKLMTAVTACRGPAGSPKILVSATICSLRIKVEAKNILLETSTDVQRNVDVFRNSLMSLHEEINKCKNSNEDFVKFEKAVESAIDTTKSCMETPP